MATLAQTPGIDLGGLDRSTSPCVDFYQYACGTWRKNNPIPPERSSWGRFDELQERNRDVLHEILEAALTASPARSTIESETGDFYAACMDQTAIDNKGAAPIEPLLKEIAGLQTKMAITDELAALQQRGIDAFFVLDSTQDAKDATQMIAEVDQGGLSLPDRDYYLKPDAKSAEIRAKFATHVQKMFELLGDTPEAAAAKSKVVMNIETDLSKGSLDVVSRRDPNKVYHKYTVAQLISLDPGIDWQKFFGAMGLPGLATLNVAFPPFMRQTESAIVQNSLPDLKTYLSWHVLNSLAPMLSKPFVDENWGFYARTLSGAEQQRPRWKRCVDNTDSLLGDALGQQYVERTFGAAGKQRTLAMVREIETSMDADIKSLAWMSETTKQQALIKLRGITNKIGYPDRWKDYSSVKILRDDALGNTIRLREWAVNHEINKIGKPVDKTEWQMTPPTVNAYYDPQMNDINFPAGILQTPFYGNNRDDAVNYGAIGAVIGHELTHGFDDQGRQFDANGNLRDWWTPQDAKEFEKRADCIGKEFSQFTAVDDVKVNGELTMGENVADSGGVRLAMMSLMRVLGGMNPGKIDGFTPEQRFFIGFGQIWCANLRPEFSRMLAGVDPHSPPQFRVNGVLSNNPDFPKAFACKPGQPMVRAQACRIW
jgi:endothelin-converting enzyme/putative endopeptidase